jgi:hypothetical protein
MSRQDQDRSSALMVEGSKLSWEIANIRSELNRHASGFEQVARKLSEYPEQIVLDKGQVSVQGRPSNFIFPEELFDIRRVCELTDQLRTKIKRFMEIREQLRETITE